MQHDHAAISSVSDSAPTARPERKIDPTRDDKLYFMHIIVYIIGQEIVRNRKTAVLTLYDVLLLWRVVIY